MFSLIPSLFLSVVLSVSFFLPIINIQPVEVSPSEIEAIEEAETAQASNPDFLINVCNTIDDCHSDIETGADLIVSNLNHPTVSSTEDGEFMPYSVTVSIPYSGVVSVDNVAGGMFDIYARNAAGLENDLPVQPVVTAGRQQVVEMIVIMPNEN